MARVEIPIVVLNPVAPYNPVSGASVAISNRQTGLTATVFVDESTNTQRLQPLTTDAEGRVQGWLDRGAYALQVTIPGRPPYTENHDATPGRDGAVDATWLGSGSVTPSALGGGSVTAPAIQAGAVTAGKLGAGSVNTAALQDGAVTGVKIGNNTVTANNLAPGAITASALAPNIVPLGQVIDWWRPNTSTAVPSGWAICDGTSWSSISNDMGLSSGTIPNLVGKVTMGARLTTTSGGTTPADGLSSGNGDAFGNAPGIGGVGGSNASKDITHTHSYVTPNHSHGVSAEAPGMSSAGFHSHSYIAEGVLGSGSGHAGYQLVFNTGYTAISASAGDQTFIDLSTLQFRTGFLQQYQRITDGNGTHSHTVNSHSHGGSTGLVSFSGSTNAASWTANPGSDFRPAHVGLLKLMKVKNV